MTSNDTSIAPPMRNHDGSAMLDENGTVVYRSQFLSTHPLKSDCKERMSGGKLLTYITGDGVIRTMNAAFGNDGWSTTITREKELQAEFRDGKYVIGYMAIVKVTLVESGASHEDCGFGEGIHESKLKAYDNAMKSAVTDAMKRAARHFGERLGNALYLYGNGMNRAPKDNKTALRDLEQQEASDLFGNQNALRELRAKNMQEAAAAASEQQGDSDKAISPDTDTLETRMPPPPKTTLVRQNTPPTGAATNQGKENSPSQLGHGFMRASELGVVVTPGQQADISGVSYQATSPQQQTPYHATKPSPPSVPCYAPLETQPSQRSPESNGNQANPLKRQKVVHNPYQQQH